MRIAPVETTARDVVVLAAGGRGLEAAADLHGELQAAVGSGRQRVVVDLAGAWPLDLTLFGILLAGRRRLNDAGGELVLLAGSTELPRVDGAVDPLDVYFRVERTLDDAVAATGGSAA